MQKKNYVAPEVQMLEMDGKVSILGLSEQSNGKLNAIFSDEDYEEEDASEAFSSKQNFFIDE